MGDQYTSIYYIYKPAKASKPSSAAKRCSFSVCYLIFMLKRERESKKNDMSI